MKFLRKISLIIILILGLDALAASSWGSFLAPGKPAPSFLVESGDNKKLSLDMIRGKVIVLFYESRHTVSQNTALKDELTRLYLTQPPAVKKEIFRLVVIDCTESSWATDFIWKQQLRENSSKEKLTIYGDWTGKMCAAYQMQTQESNFLIIDRQGIIKYTAAGKINQGQFDKIKKLLFALVGQDDQARRP